MNNILLFLVAIFISIKIFPQKQGQELTDSLLAAIPAETNDTVRVKILNKVGLYYVQVNFDSALKYANAGLKLAEKMKWEKGISAFHVIYGNIYANKGELDAALKEYQTALSYSIKIKDSINMGTAYNNLGTIANAKSDYVDAARYYFYTLEIGKAMKNYHNIGVACENLAEVYQYQGDYAKGLDYAKQSMATYQQIAEVDSYPSPLALIADFFMKMKNYDSAFIYYHKAIGISRKTNNELKEASILNSLAEYYSGRQDYTNAISSALEGKKIFDRIGPSFEDAITNKGLLGYYYLQLALQPENKKNGKAEKFLQTAYVLLSEAVQKCKETNNRTAQAEFQQSLAEVNAITGDYKNAYFNFKNYKEINDSIFSQSNKNKLAAIETQNEIDKKNLEIEAQKLRVREQKKNALILLAGLLLVSATGILFYRISVVRKQKNKELTALNKELDEANKLKAKFFGILGHDLRSPVANLVNFLNLRKIDPGALSKEQAEERENKIGISAQTLLETMESMLLWSKSQMQQFRPEKKPVKVNDLFSYLQKMFADNKTITFAFADESGIDIETDENFLKTIMYNLTANAVKALTNKTDATIKWKAWSENDKPFLSASDNGPGIRDEKIKALFDETARSGSAQGLGLHIIRDLAKAINCIISVKSNPATGTEFILSL